MSLRARLLNAWLRRFERPAMERATEPEVLRHRFEHHARRYFRPPRGTQMQWQVLEHAQRRIEALEVVPRDLTGETVLFYIHGGGFLFGSPNTHSALLGSLCARLGARAVLPRYRLAPEHPFPAAADDIRAAWEGLRASGVAADRILIGGDSAGGALALSLLGDLVADGAALPAGCFCFSPLTDLTFSGDSFRSNARAEAILPVGRELEMAEMYLAGHRPDDPRVSPHFADFTGACPLWLAVGDREILRDDARRLSARLGDARVDVTLEEHPDLPHVWPIFHNYLPEAKRTLDQLADWIRRQQPRSPDES